MIEKITIGDSIIVAVLLILSIGVVCICAIGLLYLLLERGTPPPTNRYISNPGNVRNMYMNHLEKNKNTRNGKS